MTLICVIALVLYGLLMNSIALVLCGLLALLQNGLVVPGVNSL